VGYLRPRAYIAVARRHDPIPRFGRYLRHHGLLDDRRADELSERADQEIADAVQFARQAAPPPRERAFRDVYAGNRPGPPLS
jgi:TPP-dependent pyruvate/acetoin dehydrogenase alpha subunit